MPAIAILAGVLLLAGCGPTPEAPTASSGSPSPAASSAEPTVPAPTATPSSAPATTTVGTCVPDANHSVPATYVVISDDAVTPITIQYTAFNADGSAPVVTETVVGPVATRISYPCIDSQGEALWTFTATMTTSGSVGCLLGFGGKNVSTNSTFAEHVPAISITTECTGNPGV
jgi:hypothetical protein